MEFFKPKHFNSYFESIDIGIFITFDGHIVLTNGVKNNLASENLDEVCEDIIKYSILYDGNIITYSDLVLIDNAVSTRKLNAGHIILLDTGTLLYIFDSNYTEYIIDLSTKLNGISVEYVMHTINTTLLYSNNKLYVIDEVCCEGVEDFEITIYDDVIGYLAEDDILLIMYSDLKIKNIGRMLYKICRHVKHTDPFNDKYFLVINNDDVLGGINISDVKCIRLHTNHVYILLEHTCIAFCHMEVKKNVFYDNIQFLTNIKQIDFIGSFQFCLLEDNRLLVGIALYLNVVNSCLDVINYLVINSSVVCIHSNNTLTVINMMCDEDIRRIKLNEFLVDPTNFNRIVRIKKCLEYTKIEGNYYILYLSNDSTIEILDIVSLELINLNKCLDIKVDEITLHLNSYNDECYI